MATAPLFQHTAARRRLVNNTLIAFDGRVVSTHSRLKAAGTATRCWPTLIGCFNTQPPEGGWEDFVPTLAEKPVSTHSRLKAAGT